MIFFKYFGYKCIKNGKESLRAGFEPARGDPIGFQVQRLNHSAITAHMMLAHMMPAHT